MRDIVHNSDREMVFALLFYQLVKYALHHGRRNSLDERPYRPPMTLGIGCTRCVDWDSASLSAVTTSMYSGSPTAARLLAAIQHGNGFNRGRQGMHKVLNGKRPV